EYQDRQEDRVMMFLIMRKGRRNDEKKAFYKRVVENLAKDPGIKPENILITIAENTDIDWS
ncbi:MAG: tautomerase family protein, partial [Gammaproteobacteria bacterium]|nr:tautomerase family protein [Gammaproteobacteria bacterium]NIN61864.1 tautomerase family protein [Gammaproteobacteria bacterium]NIO62951.1 tautomerase family protein [Gammaproteobacteria bacterium]NIQ19503.1 tautomerase family protein [Gammaproteobacteria bacterium]NIT05693.1 tautomerase family protein [Gammaproteobacteria bacterium]